MDDDMRALSERAQGRAPANAPLPFAMHHCIRWLGERARGRGTGKARARKGAAAIPGLQVQMFFGKDWLGDITVAVWPWRGRAMRALKSCVQPAMHVGTGWPEQSQSLTACYRFRVALTCLACIHIDRHQSTTASLLQVEIHRSKGKKMVLSVTVRLMQCSRLLFLSRSVKLINPGHGHEIHVCLPELPPYCTCENVQFRTLCIRPSALLYLYLSGACGQKNADAGEPRSRSKKHCGD